MLFRYAGTVTQSVDGWYWRCYVGRCSTFTSSMTRPLIERIIPQNMRSRTLRRSQAPLTPFGVEGVLNGHVFASMLNAGVRTEVGSSPETHHRGTDTSFCRLVVQRVVVHSPAPLWSERNRVQRMSAWYQHFGWHVMKEASDLKSSRQVSLEHRGQVRHVLCQAMGDAV